MSLHRLSAGAGYHYLLKHTACGDTQRAASTPLGAYYTASGYPPGRWTGAGLAGLGGDNHRLDAGSPVTEEQMAALFGSGRDPVTGAALGRAYPRFAPLADRIHRHVADLPNGLDPARRDELVAEIERAERDRPAPAAVAGFDLTFTVPKSASVLWALADPNTQAAVAAAHRAAVEDALAFLESRALFTRTGADGCAQVPTRGLVAAAFDHWDTRSGDPNLHTHVVIANKVQGPDGAWRSVDSRALYHAAVALSELYDDLVADQLAARLPVAWGWRTRGERRTPGYEIDGIDDRLLAAFSTRAADIDAALAEAVVDFHAAHGRGPTRVEVVRLRQRATLATRPAKTPHPLVDLLDRWRATARRLTGRDPHTIADGALLRHPARRIRADRVGQTAVQRLADLSLAEVMARRATWTPWNVLTEAARATRGLRMATATDRIHLLDRVATATLAGCERLDPADPVLVPPELRRPDGTSVFTRAGQQRYTHRRLLDAEAHLLRANATTGAPTIPAQVATRIATTAQPANEHGGQPVRLAADQVDAVVAIATSGRRLDVLVGPAGTGKTTTLRALRATWETTHGRGCVLGLAPSATAATELGGALAIGCENTAKWLHETTGAGGAERDAVLAGLDRRRLAAVAGGDTSAARRIDTARAQLLRQRQRWRLHPGQLVIVDEASLAGTLTLDVLRAQTTSAGAKLLLVGDHAQLSAVDAGGAFGLLARRGTPSRLASLWRFRHRWEAHATRRLRRGDRSVLDDYDQRGRLRGGPAQAMLDDAYTGWRHDERAGRTAILIAADNHTVTALNARAHTDRVAAGIVTGHTVPLGDQTRAGVGDRVITRLNNRRLTLPGHGHVRNGAGWHVVATHPDGALTVTPANRHPTPEPAPVVRLPAGYVTTHVDLGYATTAHRAQGVTVDACHVLAAPGMTREALYVAMTRGRDSNTVYVATDAVDPTCDRIPDQAAQRTPRDVLAAILATSGAETSATEVRDHAADDAVALHRLAPIRATLAAADDRRRWPTVLAASGLTADQARIVLDSPARGALFAALRRADNLGHSIPHVLPRLIQRHPPRPGDETHDLAAVLHHRVEQWLADAPDLTGGAPDATETLGLVGRQGPAALDRSDPLTRTLAGIDDLIRRRVAGLTDQAVATTPTWLPPLGNGHLPPEQTGDWRRHIAVVADYRDLTQAAGPDPLGDDPAGDDTARRRRSTAALAAIRARNLTNNKSITDNRSVTR